MITDIISKSVGLFRRENNKPTTVDLANTHELDLKTCKAIERINHIASTATSKEQYFEEALAVIRDGLSLKNTWLISPFCSDAQAIKYYLQGSEPECQFTTAHLNNIYHTPEYKSLCENAGSCFSLIHHGEESLATSFLPDTNQSLAIKIKTEFSEAILLGGSRGPKAIEFSHQDINLFLILSNAFKQGVYSFQRFRSSELLFNNSDIPMWCDDLSNVAEHIKNLRVRGVEDFDDYLAKNSVEVYQLIRGISVVKVNQACLRLFGVNNKNEFSRLLKSLRESASPALHEKELSAIWHKDFSHKSEANLINASGEVFTVNLNVQIPENDGDYYQVAVTVVDITERIENERRLSDSFSRYQLVVDGAFGAIWDWDVKAETVYFSDQWVALRGYEAGEISNSQSEWSRGIHRDDLQRVLDAVEQHFLGKSPVFQQEYRVICKDGSTKWVVDRGIAKWGEDGSVIRMAGSEFDITERRMLDERLRLGASVYENAAEGVMILNSDCTVLDVNHAFENILGFRKHEVIGKRPEAFSSKQKDETSYSDVWSGLKIFGKWQGEIWNTHKSGTIKPSWLTISCVYDKDQITHYVGLMTDISQIKKSEQMLYQLAHHDALTGLPNRLLLSERLEQAMKFANRRHHSVAVVFIDLDNFKLVNDAMGHAAGDRLLKQVASILSDTVRDDDTVSRIGGDEFILVLGDIKNPESIAPLANKILKNINSKVTLDGKDIRVSASMGVAVYPRDSQSQSKLIRNADAAMYRAKLSGKMNFQFYTEELTQNAIERMSLEADLHDAIKNNELVLYYQPQLDLKTRSVNGVEALLRWYHPEKGVIPPNKFISLAEETGLIGSIGEWVLKQACMQFKSWLDMGIQLTHLAINVSYRQLQKGDFTQQVRDILAITQLPPKHLEIEITESILMSDPKIVVRQLRELQQFGVNTAIDDFGTGYSSLSYLKQLPIHRLKIDRSFIQDIPGNGDDNAITEAIIVMADRLKLNVIAEGVETKEQEAFLVKNGCYCVQGFYYSKPKSAKDIVDYLLAETAPVCNDYE